MRHAEVTHAAQVGGYTMATATRTTNGAKPAEDNATIEIQRIARRMVQFPIIGTSPLILHRFSEKAKRQMLDAMQGRKSPKEAKDPDAEYQAAFLSSTRTARRACPPSRSRRQPLRRPLYAGVTMTQLKQLCSSVARLAPTGSSSSASKASRTSARTLSASGVAEQTCVIGPSSPFGAPCCKVVYVKERADPR